MKFLFVGYTGNEQFHDPHEWLFRIRAYLGVLEALARQHTVISIEQIGYTGLLKQNGVQYHFIKPVGRHNYFPARLHRLIKEQAPDIILVHGMEHPLQVIHLRSTVGTQPKIILQSHSPGLPAGIKSLVQKLADRFVNAYFFSSKLMGEPWLQKKLIANPGKLFDVPVGSSVFQPGDKSIARSKTGMGAERAYLWVGRLDNNKDPLTVVTAFLEFALTATAVKLYMIFQQDDLLPQLEAMLEKTDHRNCVHMVGHVPHNEMQNWFIGADFIISGSHFEAYGAAVVEGMSCGCIPLVSNIPAYCMITGNGACGDMFEPGTVNSLVPVLRRSLKMDLHLEEIKTRTQFDATLSFQAIAQRIAQIAALL